MLCFNVTFQLKITIICLLKCKYNWQIQQKIIFVLCFLTFIHHITSSSGKMVTLRHYAGIFVVFWGHLYLLYYFIILRYFMVERWETMGRENRNDWINDFIKISYYTYSIVANPLQKMPGGFLQSTNISGRLASPLLFVWSALVTCFRGFLPSVWFLARETHNALALRWLTSIISPWLPFLS